MDLAAVIVAVASAPGRSRRAVIRASGPGAPEVLAQIASLRAIDGAGRAAEAVPAASAPRGTYDGVLGLPPFPPAPSGADVPPVELPALVLVFRGPASFTGEDGFELVVPGHPHLLERVLDALVAAGVEIGVPVRRAEAGEFSFRAWTNGRLALEDAERLSAMIAARSEAGLRAAEQLAAEPVAAAAREVADELADLLALVEAGIDFTDEEDVVAMPAAELAARLRERRETLDAARARTADAADAEALPWVVLDGPPNAGKSTLFNALLGRERALVSNVHGTTRDVLSEVWRIASADGAVVECLLVDRPGRDERAVAAGGVDAEAQRLADTADARAAVRLVCVPPEQADARGAAGSSHRRGAAREIVVRTQVDREGGGAARIAPPLDADAAAAVRTSARTGEGLVELAARVAEALADHEDDPSRHRALVRPRHRAGLAAASAALGEAIDAIGPADSADPAEEQRASAAGPRHPEVVAHHLRTALDELAILAGRVDADDVLGRVFATFCVGK